LLNRKDDRQQPRLRRGAVERLGEILRGEAREKGVSWRDKRDRILIIIK